MPYFSRVLRRCVVVLLFLFLFCLHRDAYADASSATLYVTISDPSGAVIPSAHLIVRNTATGQEQQSESNKSGISTFSFLRPGRYQLTVSKVSFADVSVDDIVLNVGDERRLQLVLKVGSATQNVTVDGSGATLNTTDASVGTVVDRKFVENMPLNGRSFQDLISMTPGIVTASPQSSPSIQSQGDFSVNGQRTESNYYTVDGISANVGAGYPNGTAGNGTSGSISASTALGTTQSLVSVDALQEFRVSSSSYSAEYGRGPGGQFSMVTRSGANAFHGSAFDYLRNDVLDANDWFNNYNGVRKTPLRQNDFGGTVGGPLTIPHIYSGHDRSFFFVSYEGLRLTQPTAATVQYVPSLAVRSSAPAALQPVFNAFPLPTGSEVALSSGALSGLSPFVSAYSLPAVIDAASLRVDQKISSHGNAFVRYATTPTYTSSRTLSTLYRQHLNTYSVTGGVDLAVGNHSSNSFRAGYANSTSEQAGTLDTFGGATPAALQTVIGAPGSYSTYQYNPYVSVSGVGSGYINQYKASNLLHQWNVTDTVSLALGHHQLKIGIDQRRIQSSLNPAQISISPYYFSRQSMVNNSADIDAIFKNVPAAPIIQEFSAFVQDEWRVLTSLSISSGLRWEVNPAPSSTGGNMAYTALGNPLNPSTLTMAPRGTSLWNTSWYNFAPRLGVAWTPRAEAGRETVVRAGGGVFFDTGNQKGTAGFSGIGFSSYTINTGVSLPLAASAFDFSTAVTAPYTSGVVYVYPRNMQLPYTLQWNLSLDQSLGKAQVLTIGYVGSSSRRLIELQNLSVNALNSNFNVISYYPNGLTANFQSLQLKFQRSVAHGVQSLASYTWSHSLDYGSTNASIPLTYGNSDFDIRQNLQAGLTWDIPTPASNHLLQAAVGHWGLDGRLNIRSGFPITLLGNTLVDASGNRYYSGVNYDPKRPIYLYGSQYPGGRMINGGPNVSNSTAAFTAPTGTTVGNAARNFVRGFGANQINTALRRDIHIYDDLSLKFRAEAFNIFNQPNFGYIDPTLTDAQFGRSTKMLNSSLGSMSSLYQQGGSRSLQFSLRLEF